jgi:hypothetical protein
MPLNCSSETYSASCIAAVASKAGFGANEDMLTTAVAVALAESSGRTKAVSPTGCCHGLWQINTEVHPYSKSQMQDPAQNAAAAWKISNGGTNWKPWSAYTNGSYLLYKTTARRAAKSPGDILIDELGDDIPDFTDATQSLSDIRDWISDRNNIFRIVKVISGGLIVAVGVNMIMKAPVQMVIKEVKQ